MEDQQEDEFDKEPLMPLPTHNQKEQSLRLKDLVNGNQTLAFQLKPKVILLIN